MPFLFGFSKPPQHVVAHPNSSQPGLWQPPTRAKFRYSLPVLGIFVRYRLCPVVYRKLRVYLNDFFSFKTSFFFQTTQTLSGRKKGVGNIIVGLEMNRSILQICNLHQRSLLRFTVSLISDQADHSRISRTMRFFAFPDAALNMVRIA